jgi:hypothetical protein
VHAAQHGGQELEVQIKPAAIGFSCERVLLETAANAPDMQRIINVFAARRVNAAHT